MINFCAEQCSADFSVFSNIGLWQTAGCILYRKCKIGTAP